MVAAVLLGLAAAHCWGVADFIARFSSRAFGLHLALLGMLAASSLIFTILFYSLGHSLVWMPQGVLLLLFSGVGIMLATLLLYKSLLIGPVTIAAPIVGSYPVFMLMMGLLRGVFPTAEQLAALVVVMVGVMVVAACAPQEKEAVESGHRRHFFSHRRRVVLIALQSAVLFGVSLSLAQQASDVYGQWPGIMLLRWTSFLAIAFLVLFYFLSRRVQRPMTIQWRLWPLLVVQGVLDGSAYLAILYSGAALAGQITAVISSGFSAVTVLLARWILHEQMSMRQWLGIMAILAGVGWLVWLGEAT